MYNSYIYNTNKYNICIYVCVYSICIYILHVYIKYVHIYNLIWQFVMIELIFKIFFMDRPYHIAENSYKREI